MQCKLNASFLIELEAHVSWHKSFVVETCVFNFVFKYTWKKIVETESLESLFNIYLKVFAVQTMK